jgi:hypothetical protein
LELQIKPNRKRKSGALQGPYHVPGSSPLKKKEALDVSPKSGEKSPRVIDTLQHQLVMTAKGPTELTPVGG